MTELFTRHGTGPFTGQFTANEKGQRVFREQRPCSRCGGAGGSDKWAHTGWTCFDCGGNGRGKIATVRLFTAEEITKLNAAQEKRNATKAAKLAAKAAEAKAAAEARAADFEAIHGALMAKAEAFAERSEFIKDVTAKARARNELSEKQAEALANTIAKIEASDRQKAASGFVGTVGKRITVTVTAERVVSFETQFGVLRIATMRDTAGNAIVAKGKFVPPTANFNRETERWEITAEPFTIKGTVKEHGSFRDERQTVLQRVAVVETKAVPA